MKFMITFPLSSDSFKERTRQFLDTGGGPPEGVTMEGRWHGVSGSVGWVLASTNDPKAIFKWIGEWMHLIDFEVEPVLEDEDAASVLKTLNK